MACQLSLLEPPPRPAVDPENALLGALRRLIDGHLATIVLTDNKRRILSCRWEADGGHLRIHRCFLDAPAATLIQVAVLAQPQVPPAARRMALQEVRRHFEAHGPRQRPAGPRRVRARPFGEHFDLRQIRNRLNRRYFGGALQVEITWGRRHARRRRPRRSIRLGSYDPATSLVRVHPVLDHRAVPLAVVESIVYHELLHAANPPIHRGGRRVIHTPELRRKERQFEAHDEAESWIRENLDRLLSSR